MPPKSAKAQQPSISSYWSPKPNATPVRRNASLIDLTGSDQEEHQGTPPPSKKPRLEKGTNGVETADTTVSRFFTPKKPVFKSSGPTQARSVADSPVSKYAFQSPGAGPSGSHEEEMLTPQQLTQREKRREAIRTKLGGHFERDDAESLRLAEDDPNYDLIDGPNSKIGQPASELDDEEPPEVIEVAATTLSAKLDTFAAEPSKVSTSKGKGKKEPKRAKRAPEEIGPSGQKYTPLEKQILESKAAHPDCLLMFEVGYKYRFFGPDAQIASKELGIACFPDRNFLTASIPVHRKNVHVKKLIAQGHKVGIIGQTETAALKKVGNNKAGPFERQLTELYTAATFVDELSSADDMFDDDQTGAPALTCFVESLLSGQRVSVTPSTGEVTYDEWEDSHMRTELETRITHIRPGELLIPGGNALSPSTERMLNYFTGNKRFNAGRDIRTERFSPVMSHTEAIGCITDFYHKNPRAPNIVVALAHTIEYLSKFKVANAFLEATFFTNFVSRTHMLLNGTTLTNLEIYRNSTNFSQTGSLLWILDHTKTKFGSRMLKSWIGRPLTDKVALDERIEAVEEVLNEPPPAFEKLKTLLKGLPDLVKGLARITYGRCTPKEFAGLFAAYQRIANTFESNETSEFRSPLWNDIVKALPRLRPALAELKTIVDVTKARFDEPKANLWLDEDMFPELVDSKFSIMCIESELNDELKEIRKLLKRPSLQWAAVGGDEYLIQLTHAETKRVPPNWLRVSSTKSLLRYHTPLVKRKLAERDEQNEKLSQAAEDAWQSFLGDCSRHYGVMRDVTNMLAKADCLASLAIVSAQPGYTKPDIVDSDVLHITSGRHPMVEVMRSDPFVPNSVMMGGGDTRTKIITGPNMNGKSTTCRMIALIAIMAQIGSYVPASTAVIGLHDCVLTRMGAEDDLARGHSTFMVELQETSDIMRQATARSLIILDELGRGTSTHDGQAIAMAVLDYLVTIKKPKLLFITHYPLLAADFAEKFDDVANMFMAHELGRPRHDGSVPINFLYRLVPGMTSGSYGIECARLAGIPDAVLASAQKRSDTMKIGIERTAARHKWSEMLRNLMDSHISASEHVTTIQSLRQSLV